ncbi:MAG: hypothetical protein NZ703_13340, partial [Gemmataceae bacterium]|nr:hypothetical protein [Gemmataceae bacterium]
MSADVIPSERARPADSPSLAPPIPGHNSKTADTITVTRVKGPVRKPGVVDTPAVHWGNATARVKLRCFLPTPGCIAAAPSY